ncbi:hypothetical protein [Hymenobacter sp. PAMC 26628]|uniref:hypothetical protein n=1 Tax=Hymenobacter sp. PAMC 26628 TaxID=1484118 RepID=UPI0007700576|nr:hypothetical protein [Hymenobacter sp. PAMC 26628]AMJ64031.1 hypothetical protein AXW84_00250 [Hymenobacter sp. PAMC 26628]
MELEHLLEPSHPKAAIHQQQLARLAGLPEQEREDEAQLLRVGNAAYRYHELADGHQTPADFEHWLAGLPLRMKEQMEQAGFEAVTGSWAFRRHILERRSIGYGEFMQLMLAREDWEFMQQQLKDPVPDAQ